MTFQAAFYKGTREGFQGVYNRLVRWWTKSQYSHCEIIFSDGVAASSSYMDGGVRFKKIEFSVEKWDFAEIPAQLEPLARLWFEQHLGQKYDLLGNVHFIISVVPDDSDKWSCSESVAASLGMRDPWRFYPGVLASVLNVAGAEPLDKKPPIGYNAQH
jgi:hypothetical protein